MEVILFNIGILLSLSVFFTTYPFKNPRRLYSYRVLVGVIIGFIGILVMLNPLVLSEGVVFDSRTILIAVSGMVFGVVPTVIGSSMIAVLRIINGGSGLAMGLATITASATIGILWHRFRYEQVLKHKRQINLEFYLVGLVVHLVMLLCVLLMPKEVRPQVFAVMTLPILLIYPVGTYLLCLLLFGQAYRYQDIAALSKSEHLFKTMFEEAPIGMSLTNIDTGQIENINQSYLDMLGYSREEVLGRTWVEFTHEDDKHITEAVVERMRKGMKDVVSVDKRLIRKDGTVLWANLSLCFFSPEDSPKHESLCMTVDITERKRTEQSILYASTHDGLTGFYNRTEFERLVGDLVISDELPFTVVIADVNRMRIINEAFGREAGNTLLRQVAQIIGNYVDESSWVFRIGGDEFALLMPRQNLLACEARLEKIRHSVSQILVMNSVNPSISFGICELLDGTIDLNEAIQRAEKELATQKLLDSPHMQGKAVFAIINTLHEKNKREEQHSRRVSELCERLAVSYGMGERAVSEMRLLGLLHDIGKIAISESILNKEGRLDDQQWREVQRHSEIGYRILSSVEDMASLAQYVLAHHERYDGKGYPKGLCGEEIPLQSRMITVADAYDAMTAKRPYRNAVTPFEAAREIKACAGLQFDPELARIFINEVVGLNYEELLPLP